MGSTSGSLDDKVKSASFASDLEVDRVLGAYANDPFTLLELDVWSRPAADSKLPSGERFPTPNDVKKAYRVKSLLLHPDKCKHERAPDAFALLKKAETALSDDNRRKELFEQVDEARLLVIEERGGPKAAPLNERDLAPMIRFRFKRLQEDTENRAKILRVNEVERKAKEEMDRDTERKRKAEHDKQWEATREARVNDWRKFMNKGQAKTKKAKTSNSPYPD